jgi:Bacterial PH domain
VCTIAPALQQLRRGPVDGYVEVLALVGLALLVLSLIAPASTCLTRSGVEIRRWGRRRWLGWADVVDVKIPGGWPVPFEGGPSGLVCRSGEVVGLPGMPRAARRRLAAALTAWRNDTSAQV